MNSSGEKWVSLWLGWGITQLIYVPSMERVNYRPCAEAIPIGCDSSTRARLKKYGRRIRVKKCGYPHAFDLVSFQSRENQITRFDSLAYLEGAETYEGSTEDLLNQLRDWYNTDTVNDLIDFYQSGHSLLDKLPPVLGAL